MAFTIVSCDFERVKRLKNRSKEEVGGSAGGRQFVGSVHDGVKSRVCGYLLCGGIRLLMTRAAISTVKTQHNATMWTIFK